MYVHTEKSKKMHWHLNSPKKDNTVLQEKKLTTVEYQTILYIVNLVHKGFLPPKYKTINGGGAANRLICNPVKQRSPKESTYYVQKTETY